MLAQSQVLILQAENARLQEELAKEREKVKELAQQLVYSEQGKRSASEQHAAAQAMIAEMREALADPALYCSKDACDYPNEYCCRERQKKALAQVSNLATAHRARKQATKEEGK